MLEPKELSHDMKWLGYVMDHFSSTVCPDCGGPLTDFELQNDYSSHQFKQDCVFHLQKHILEISAYEVGPFVKKDV